MTAKTKALLCRLGFLVSITVFGYRPSSEDWFFSVSFPMLMGVFIVFKGFSVDPKSSKEVEAIFYSSLGLVLAITILIFGWMEPPVQKVISLFFAFGFGAAARWFEHESVEEAEGETDPTK